MLKSFPRPAADWLPRWRDRQGRRLLATSLALLIEGLLVLVVVSLGLSENRPTKPLPKLISVTLTPEAESAAEPAPAKARQAQPGRSSRQPQADRPAPQSPQTAAMPQVPATPPFIPMQHDQMAALDIANLPHRGAPTPGRAVSGPPDQGVPGDSTRVGTAPNGQPLYAATWYREPADDELRGFLSTADGPGWALIVCRTVPDFRIEDCTGLDEYPAGSRIQRAVLAAAWQFRVRPPRVGGVSQVGDWVRIRIEYSERRR